MSEASTLDGFSPCELPDSKFKISWALWTGDPCLRSQPILVESASLLSHLEFGVGEVHFHTKVPTLACSTLALGHNENVGITNSVSMFQMYGKDSRSRYWKSWTGLRYFRCLTPLPRRIRILFVLG